MRCNPHCIAIAVVAILATSARGQDTPGAATISLRDLTNKVVPGARVSWESAGTTRTGTTDAQGCLRLEIPARADKFDEGKILVEADGFLPLTWKVSSFPGALYDLPLYVGRRQETIIQIRGPKGEPIPDLPISMESSSRQFSQTYFNPISSESASGRTNRQGDFIWSHGELTALVTITAGSRRIQTRDAQTILVNVPANALNLAPTLSGKLLYADGKPATNWLVATGGWGYLSMSVGSSWDFVTHVEDTPSAFQQLGVDRFVQPALDGAFQIPGPFERLFLVSPEGIPFPFRLDPRSWDVSEHHVTLTVPQPSSILREQFVDAAGQPMRNLPIVPIKMQSHTSYWAVSDEKREYPYQSSDTYRSSPIAAAVTVNSNGPKIGHLSTDTQGMISLPIYWGDPVAEYCAGPYSTDRWPPGDWVATPDIGKGPRIVLTPVQRKPEPPATKPIALKMVHVRLVDLAGQFLPHAQLTGLGIEPDEPRNFRAAAVTDSLGSHFLVPIATTAIWVNTRDEHLVNHYHGVPIPPSGEHIILKHTLEPQSNTKVTGRVLDEEGNPVVAAQVRVSTGKDEYDRRWLDRIAYTDEAGNFEVAGIPEVGRLAVTRSLDRGSPLNRQENAEVTAASRIVNVQFSRPNVGSIKILLPEPLAQRYALREHPSVFLVAKEAPLKPVYIKSNNTDLCANDVPPGIYHFDPGSLLELGDLSDTTVNVMAGQESNLDFRQKAVARYAIAPYRRIAVNVTVDGKPFSGAQVAVMAYAMSPEEVDARIKVWRAVKDPKRVYFSPEYYLQDGGGAVLEFLNTQPPSPELDALRDKIDPHSGLDTLVSDLSDSSGMVHFTGQQGSIYVVVAQVHSMLAGWQMVTLAPDTNAVQLNLMPARSLVIHAPHAATHPPLFVKIVTPKGLEAHALDLLLGPGLGPSGLPWRMQLEGDDYVLHGLPTGVTVEFPDVTPILKRNRLELTTQPSTFNLKPLYIPPGTQPLEITVEKP